MDCLLQNGVQLQNFTLVILRFPVSYAEDKWIIVDMNA
jgi:hypothetical protein